VSFTQPDRVSIDRVPIRRALISVYDKTGLEDLAKGLHAAGVKIVSTGSTAKKIAAAGIPVQEVEEVTGSPEMLDGRVKTLHPRVHGGILADRRVPAHMETLAGMEIETFDLVVTGAGRVCGTSASSEPSVTSSSTPSSRESPSTRFVNVFQRRFGSTPSRMIASRPPPGSGAWRS